MLILFRSIIILVWVAAFGFAVQADDRFTTAVSACGLCVCFAVIGWQREVKPWERRP